MPLSQPHIYSRSHLQMHLHSVSRLIIPKYSFGIFMLKQNRGLPISYRIKPKHPTYHLWQFPTHSQVCLPSLPYPHQLQIFRTVRNLTLPWPHCPFLLPCPSLISMQTCCPPIKDWFPCHLSTKSLLVLPEEIQPSSPNLYSLYFCGLIIVSFVFTVLYVTVPPLLWGSEMLLLVCAFLPKHWTWLVLSNSVNWREAGGETRNTAPSLWLLEWPTHHLSWGPWKSWIFCHDSV